MNLKYHLNQMNLQPLELRLYLKYRLNQMNLMSLMNHLHLELLEHL